MKVNRLGSISPNWDSAGSGRTVEISKGTESPLQHHSSKTSVLQHSAFFMVQLSHSYTTTGKNMALTKWTFIGKVMSLLFNTLFRLVIAFLPRGKCLLISWPQSSSAVILEPRKIKSVISREDNCGNKEPEPLTMASKNTGLQVHFRKGD